MHLVLLNLGDLSVATLDDVDVEGKRVLLRVDFNSPVNPETGEILDDTRIRAHVETIRELIDKRAAVAIISHQGRPFDKDFTSLRRHSKILSEIMSYDVMFVEDICFESALQAISRLKPGDILLLENVRLISEENIETSIEQHSKSYLVSRLSPHFSLFVNDAFSACHRSQASLVGFPLRLPSAAGRLMEKEVRALAIALKEDRRPRVLVVGGAKVDDVVKFLDKALSRNLIDTVLTTGLVALVFLASKGSLSLDLLPKSVRDEKIIQTARQLMEKFKDRILTPIDFVIESENGVKTVQLKDLNKPPKDIGEDTVREYGSVIEKANLIIMKGPAGVIEDPRFRRGTEELVAKSLESQAYTIFGGGHLISIVESMPANLRKKASHLSMAGGALLYSMTGEKLPCLEALSQSARLFNIGVKSSS